MSRSSQGRDDPWSLKPFRIIDKVRESADVYTFELEAENDFGFSPGQFNMLYAFGKGEVPVSISGAGSSPRHLVHTIRDVGKITSDICAREIDDIIDLRGPYGSAWPLREAEGRDVLVVAGGIGLAPVRPVIHGILENRDKYAAFSLLCGARTPDDLIFVEELESYEDRTDIEIKVTVDIAPRGWTGHVGVITTLLDQLSVRLDDTIVMTCGPEIMMRFTAQLLRDRGIPEDNIFVSMERNMKCAIGFCGHCMYGPHFICRDGPVFRYDRIQDLMMVREV